MSILDLFSGIGAFSLGLERAGMKTVAFCEIDPFCRRVLAKHWPEVCWHRLTRNSPHRKLRQRYRRCGSCFRWRPRMDDTGEQPWCLSHRADPAARRLADRHYNRQKHGAPQFVPPGSCLVLLSKCGRAFWVTSAPLAEYVKHAWAGAWVCSAFRSEGAGVASYLIRSAVAATLAYYGEPPRLGMVTFIDRAKVRPIKVHGKPVWGWTYRKAGFSYAGETKGGLLALQLLPNAMPKPWPAAPRAMLGMPLFDGCVL